MPSVEGVDEFFPLAYDPAWRAFKDAAYALLAERAALRDAPEESAARERRVVRALAEVAPDPGAERVVSHAVFDVSFDIGRHALAKRLVEDSLPEATRVIDAAFRGAGLGELAASDLFHRALRHALTPSAELAAARAPVATSHVAGLLAGYYSEAFKCRADIGVVDRRTFSVRLGDAKAAQGVRRRG